METVSWSVVQTWLNVIVLVISSLMGWFVRALFSQISDVAKAERETAAKVEEVRVMLPTHYVSKVESERQNDQILKFLQRIEDKLDRKVDKI